MEAASATASVRQITCATPVSSSTVKVHTDAQAVRARVGTLSDINAANPTLSDATILNVLGVASVTARADISLAGSSSDLTFHGPFDWDNTQTVGSSSLGLGNLIESQPLDLTLHVLPPSHPCMTAEAALKLKGLGYEKVKLSVPHNDEMERLYGPGNRTVPGLTIDGNRAGIDARTPSLSQLTREFVRTRTSSTHCLPRFAGTCCAESSAPRAYARR